MRLFKIMMVLLIIFLPLIPFRQAMSAEPESPAFYTEDKPVVMVNSKQPEFTIKLKSNATTGYAWYLRSYDANLLQPIKQSFEPPDNPKLIGAPGHQVWVFKVKPAGFSVPMQTTIRFVYIRPWETSDGTNQVIFQVTTKK